MPTMPELLKEEAEKLEMATYEFLEKVECSLSMPRGTQYAIFCEPLMYKEVVTLIFAQTRLQPVPTGPGMAPLIHTPSGSLPIVPCGHPLLRDVWGRPWFVGLNPRQSFDPFDRLLLEYRMTIAGEAVPDLNHVDGFNVMLSEAAHVTVAARLGGHRRLAFNFPVLPTATTLAAANPNEKVEFKKVTAEFHPDYAHVTNEIGYLCLFAKSVRTAQAAGRLRLTESERKIREVERRLQEQSAKTLALRRREEGW